MLSELGMSPRYIALVELLHDNRIKLFQDYGVTWHNGVYVFYPVSETWAMGIRVSARELGFPEGEPKIVTVPY